MSEVEMQKGVLVEEIDFIFDRHKSAVPPIVPHESPSAIRFDARLSAKVSREMRKNSTCRIEVASAYYRIM